MFKPKVGLIGIGKWGKILRDKLKKNTNLIFEANSKSNFKKKLNKIDWVFVATPDKTHFQIVKNLINFKKNVFCEKPLSLNYKKSKLLFDLAEKKQVKLYVDDIQTFYNNNLKIKKENFITRKKMGKDNPKNLLYRFAYHDFYYLAYEFKKRKIKSIKIIDALNDLKFHIRCFDNTVFKFDYSLNSSKKIHKINDHNFVTKKDLLTMMIKKVLNEKVNFKKNKEISLFSNKIIDKIQKKLIRLS